MQVTLENLICCIGAVLTLALAMAVPAFAETTTTTYTITIKNGTGTYAAYQIFKGDLHDNTLSNIDCDCISCCCRFCKRWDGHGQCKRQHGKQCHEFFHVLHWFYVSLLKYFGLLCPHRWRGYF